MSHKKSKKDSDEKKHSIQLSKNRYLSVEEFKNKIRVDIREYYINDDGERKPGKKGISLSEEEWKVIKNNFEKIQEYIKEVRGDSDSESD